MSSKGHIWEQVNFTYTFILKENLVLSGAGGCGFSYVFVLFTWLCPLLCLLNRYVTCGAYQQIGRSPVLLGSDSLWGQLAPRAVQWATSHRSESHPRLTNPMVA